jgi:hypothetical protein
MANSYWLTIILVIGHPIKKPIQCG